MIIRSTRNSSMDPRTDDASAQRHVSNLLNYDALLTSGDLVAMTFIHGSYTR